MTVGLFCNKASETPTEFGKNVGAKCLKAGNNVDQCFNKMNRDATKTLREKHGAVALEEDTSEAANLVQKLKDISDADWKNGAIKLPERNLGKQSGCQDLFYKFDGADGASNLAFMTTPLAVNQWYSYKKFYDFEKGTTIYPAGATDANKK